VRLSRPALGSTQPPVQRLAIGWTVQGSNPSGGRDLCACRDQPWGPPSLLYSDWLYAGQSRDRIPVGGRDFCACRDQPWGAPSLLYNGYHVFPGGKEQPGHGTDALPRSSAVGHERVELYLYSPYGLYGLYRASVPVQGRALPYSRAIPVLPLRAVRPVHSLSSCTRVTFTLE
jgi:hypothetical protein